MIVILLTQKF
uniref:Uncharacterized protein n=1 Tax=Nymphaea colorata TaxID=210225 RepID=A0A5K1DC40_9MAGN